MRVYHNVKLSDEFHELLMEHYWSDDKNDPSKIAFIPSLSFISDMRDLTGNRMPEARLGYTIIKLSNYYFKELPIFPFDNNRKFFTVEFARDRFDVDATYLFEYFDRTIYVLRERPTAWSPR